MSRELITVAEMRAIDAAATAAGVPVRKLMQHAGEAAADVVAATPQGSVAVLCGPGDNGGDGWVAAQALKRRGWDVAVWSLVPRDALKGAAAEAAADWDGAVGILSAETPRADLYIDALFGAGLSRPLEGPAARLALELPPERVFAVDVPSGLEGDTGKPKGEACFHARTTITFVRKKPAHALYPGRAICGEVIVKPIGTPEGALIDQNVMLWENDPVLWRSMLPWPRWESHKHRRGHVMVASGGKARTGAARLSARGALRIGAGLVTVLSPNKAMAENAAQLTAIMLRETETIAALEGAAKDANVLVIGPAFGTDTTHKSKLDAVLKIDGALVLDADALTLLAPLAAPLAPRHVMTPHVGEFRRLFPDLADTASKVEAARAAAKRANAVVLYKGPDTVIAAPDGRAIVSNAGTPFLATAGAGDVLAGFIAGLIGQGMSSFEAASAAAWLHGKCAEEVGPGLIAEDLPEVLPRVLKALYASIE